MKSEQCAFNYLVYYLLFVDLDKFCFDMNELDAI